MRVELKHDYNNIIPLIRDSHGFCVVITQVHCALRTLRLTRDAKYLSSKGRLWILERDSYMQQ